MGMIMPPWPGWLRRLFLGRPAADTPNQKPQEDDRAARRPDTSMSQDEAPAHSDQGQEETSGRG